MDSIVEQVFLRYGSFLFYTYNRLHQFAKAQQALGNEEQTFIRHAHRCGSNSEKVATKMYAKFKKVQHLLWAIF